MHIFFVRTGRIAIFIALLACTMVPVPARAEAGQAFSISKPIIELQAKPGQTINATLKFTNLSGGELLVKSQFNDFGSKNESGEPHIIFEDTESTTYSLRQWIAAQPPFKIASKETKTITFAINVPADAEPGGHYAVIRFTGNTPEVEESGVALTASIGSLILLQVAGDIKEDAHMAEFFTVTPKGAKTHFFENSPITFAERIQNKGNVHIKPTGTIEITDMFGQKVGALRVNGDPATPPHTPRSILPESIRRFEQKLESPWLFGKYEAKLNLSYGQGQKPLTATLTFWVMPYKLIILTLAAGVLAGFALQFSVKKYNAHIISKAARKKT